MRETSVHSSPWGVARTPDGASLGQDERQDDFHGGKVDERASAAWWLRRQGAAPPQLGRGNRRRLTTVNRAMNQMPLGVSTHKSRSMR